MRSEPQLKQTPASDVFDDEDMVALPAILEGLADLEAGRSFSADEVDKRLSEEFKGR